MTSEQLSNLVLSTTLLVATFFSCNNSNGSKTTENKEYPKKNVIQIKTPSTLDTVSEIDSSIINADSSTISGQLYTAFYRTDGIFFIINSKNDTVFSDKELGPNFEFDDFNDDGCKDIRFHHMANTPIEDLILFDKKRKKFRKVANFINYPEPIKILGTKFYYSYHKSGCSDLNWDSDLFYIVNFKTFRIGNIAGRGCNDGGKKDCIYVNKVIGEKEMLYNTLPIETIEKYKDYKWGFIKDYWIKNYNKFE